MQTEPTLPSIVQSKGWHRMKWAMFLATAGILVFAVVSEWGNLRAEGPFLLVLVALMALNAPVRRLPFQIASVVVAFAALGLSFWLRWLPA